MRCQTRPQVDSCFDKHCLDKFRAGDYHSVMTSPRHAQYIAESRFDSPEQEAYLALWRTYDRLRAVEDETVGRFDLSAQQYNLLRLLAGAAEPVPASRLAAKLISRAPDVTRMLDRLLARGLVTRARSDEDRRAVLVAATDAGRELLAEIAGPLAECHARQLGHLTAGELESLTALLKLARAPHEPAGGPWS